MDYKNWAEREWEKCEKKITKTAERIQGNIPYSTKDGKYGFVSSVDCWTNSFWSGILWLMYTETKEDKFKKCRLIPDKLYRADDKAIHLTPEGFLVSNAVIGILTDI